GQPYRSDRQGAAGTTGKIRRALPQPGPVLPLTFRLGGTRALSRKCPRSFASPIARTFPAKRQGPRAAGTEASGPSLRSGRQTSVRLQQTVDVVELFLRALLLAGAAAQLVENLAALLALQLERYPVDAVVGRRPHASGLGAAERIAILAAPLLLLDLGEVLAVAGAALAHLLGHVAHALLQVVERAALGAAGLARIAAAQRLLGLAHRALGATQRFRHLHAVLVELLHEVAELVAQMALLVALVVAPLLVAALLTLALSGLLALLTLLPALAL